MIRKVVLAGIAHGVLLLGVPGAVAQEATSPCADPRFREMDFWVGTWDLRWDNADGSTGTGSNIITRDEYGDCVIYEHFSAPQMQGMSVSTFHVPTGVWRQTWVDDSGGYFALTGGPVDDDTVAFELRNTRLSDSEPQLRMIWEDVEDGSLTWRWQRLAADGDPDSDAWQDSWVIRYQRRD